MHTYTTQEMTDKQEAFEMAVNNSCHDRMCGAADCYRCNGESAVDYCLDLLLEEYESPQFADQESGEW